MQSFATLGLILCFFFLNLSAQEEKVLGKLNLIALAKGAKIQTVRIMESGEVWLITTAVRGQNIELVRKNLFTREVSSQTLPILQADCAEVSLDGQFVLLYQHLHGEFWHIDVYKQKHTLLMKREKGKKGFALYGERRSFLAYLKDSAIALGYLYDEKLQFGGNYWVKMPLTDISPTGVEIKKLLSEKHILSIAQKHFPQAEQLGRIAVGERYLSFATWNSKKEGGRLLGIDLNTKQDFLIDEFKFIFSTAISPQDKYLAYIKSAEAGKNDLYIFDLNEKTKKKLFTGRAFDVVFNPKGDKLAVGAINANLKDAPKTKEGKEGKVIFHEKIVLIQLNDRDREKVYPLSQKEFYPYWRFVKEDKHIILFDGTSSFYRLDLDRQENKQEKATSEKTN